MPKTNITVPPFGFTFQVFTDRVEYTAHCKKENLWDNPKDDENGFKTAQAYTSFTDPKSDQHLSIALFLPKIEEVTDFDFEEIIDHELIHVLFILYGYFGVWVGKKVEFHEMFCWHHNYLDREIKTKVYKLKAKNYEPNRRKRTRILPKP